LADTTGAARFLAQTGAAHRNRGAGQPSRRRPHARAGRRELGGCVYEPEPWELARQLRLQRHAQQRDLLAGIVIYDGDCNATNEVPVDADPDPPTATEHPSAVFPDEFDQRPPEDEPVFFTD
jgi:hypothetical protein